MTAPRSEASDPGGPKGPARRNTSRFVSSIGAVLAILLAPLAGIAITAAVVPGASSGEADPVLMLFVAIAALALSGFGILGAVIGRRGHSRGLVIYGWIVAGVLLASGVAIGVAAIINAAR